MTIKNIIERIRLVPVIGYKNIYDYLAFIFKKNFPFSALRRINSQIHQGTFFEDINFCLDKSLASNEQWINKQTYFSWHSLETEDIPDWHASCISKETYYGQDLEWHKIDTEVGGFDIKEVWEASRMDWLICFAQSLAKGDKSHLEKINSWLNDWVDKNDAYKGSNWVCSQEASIRVLNLFLAAVILRSERKELLLPLESFLKCHLTRIDASLQYASAQQNNHFTTEAVALFVGGSWLKNNSKDNFEWSRKGRIAIEEAISKLILPDGTFSQFSTNYHRLMLDSISIALLAVKKFQLAEFSSEFMSSMCKASEWLYDITDSISGEIPNIGPNDGAKIFNLKSDNYRESIQSLQFAYLMFKNKLILSNHGTEILDWLNLSKKENEIPKKASKVCNEGGFAIINKEDSMVVMRLPIYRFRPKQCDAGHLDFWRNGINKLRDGGSFRYTESEFYDSVEAHNTIQFDRRDQMKKLSRFLYKLNWPKVEEIGEIIINKEETLFEMSYRDSLHCFHKRSVRLNRNNLIIKDLVSDFREVAMLSWRLEPGDWLNTGMSFTKEKEKITFKSDDMDLSPILTKQNESLYYRKKSEIPVVKINLDNAGEVTTIYSWETE